jgi:hypothetical protein
MIVYGGSSAPHVGWKRHCLPCLARIGEDRFVSLAAQAGPGGTLVTRPLIATGAPLCLSADAGGGIIKVEVLGEAGFEMSNSVPIRSDGIRHVAGWTNADFASLKGKAVRLKIEITGAKLFSLSGLALPPAP